MKQKPLFAVLHIEVVTRPYADDTQAYLVIKPIDNWINIATLMETCLSGISAWMKSNMLKLNQDKTELIFLASSEI
jgi:hypothetical protein